MLLISQYKKAFTMVELLFVIVILGIVSSIGAEIIAKVYSSYIIERAHYRASLKTELAAQQIANRLMAIIPDTVIRRKTWNDTAENINDAVGNSSVPYNVLQWVGADMDSFSTSTTPGWSGFCDTNTSSTSKNNISTPGSNLSLASDIIENLNGGSLPSSASWKIKIFFPYDRTGYDIDKNDLSDANITLEGAGASHIVEHYKLAWTSYALRVDNDDLYLYYGFDPKYACLVPSNNTKRSLLLKNVTTFQFMGSGRTIRFKICVEENIGEDFNVTACKEKAVF